jgi:hypothetical protein
MILGKWVSSAISAAAHFGIADHLEAGPKSPRELASLTGTQERPLYRLLRANASVGVFTELEDGRFAQTPLSEPLRTDARPCVRHMAMMLTDDWHIRSWEQLPWCVETGQPASYKLNGMPMFDWMSQHPEKTVNFNNAMTDMSSGDAAAILQNYDFSHFEHIVDVAGGHGTLLAAILDQAPKLRGTLVEMPHVIQGARQAGTLDRFAKRCALEAGSMFESVPAGADAYIMKFIIHDWYDPECIRILGNCRKWCRPATSLARPSSWTWRCSCSPGAWSGPKRNSGSCLPHPVSSWSASSPRPRCKALSKAYRSRTCRTKTFFGRRSNWRGKPSARARSRSAPSSFSTAA